MPHPCDMAYSKNGGLFGAGTGRIRFAINPGIVCEQGLEVSARFLQIATLIDD